MNSNEMEQILCIYSAAKNRILLYLESAVPSEQFKALRRLILDELGRSGAEGKVRELLERKGQARAESGKGGGGNG